MKQVFVSVLICVMVLASVAWFTGPPYFGTVHRTIAPVYFQMPPAHGSILVADPVPDTSPAITEDERAALVVGLVIGLDIALALEGSPALEPAKFNELLAEFAQVTGPCATIHCVTDKLVNLRNNIRAKTPAKPEGPEILR